MNTINPEPGISSPAPVPDGAPGPRPPVAAAPRIPASIIVYALNHPARLTAVRALAGGARLSITQLAALTDQPPDQVAKHLKCLRNAGILVAARRPADTRQWDHEIPGAYRVKDATGRAVLDFGGMVLRLE